MNIVGDAFTVGIVLLLLIAAVSFYLYTRLAQVEKHMSLLESILLDLKVATENSFMGFPGFNLPPTPSGGGKPGRAPAVSDVSEEEGDLENILSENFIPTMEEDMAIEADSELVDESELEKALESATSTDDDETDDAPAPASTPTGNFRVVELSGDAASALTDNGVHVNKIEPQYETMTVKELKQLANNRGIKGVGKMSRTEILDSLRKKDAGIEDGVSMTAAPSSFDSSSFFGGAAAIDA